MIGPLAVSSTWAVKGTELLRGCPLRRQRRRDRDPRTRTPRRHGKIDGEWTAVVSAERSRVSDALEPQVVVAVGGSIEGDAHNA